MKSMYVVFSFDRKKKKDCLMKFSSIAAAIVFGLTTSACHDFTIPMSTSHAAHQATVAADKPKPLPFTHSRALSVQETHPLKGSEKVTVHAYSYTRGSDSCSRTIALNFSSTLSYTHTLIALKNRALVTGANAVSITDWHEHAGVTTLTGHFFDCHSKRGL